MPRRDEDGNIVNDEGGSQVGFSTDTFMFMMMVLRNPEAKVAESITLTVPQLMAAIAEWEKEPSIERMGNWTGISCQWPGISSVHWKRVEEEGQKTQIMISVNRVHVFTFTPEGGDDPNTFVPPVWLMAGSPERFAQLVLYMTPKSVTASA